VALFVINEWLWADSRGDNGRDRQREAFNLIVNLAASDHQIVVIEGSAFDEKAWKLCKSTDTVVVEIASVYCNILRFDSNRCVVLKSDAIPEIPDNLSAAVKDDDQYLVRAQLSVAGAVLVTTDEPLGKVVREHGLSCLSREDFLQGYF
jgi:hypothetical protein